MIQALQTKYVKESWFPDSIATNNCCDIRDIAAKEAVVPKFSRSVYMYFFRIESIVNWEFMSKIQT